jgi:hypothetical protein
LVDTASHAGRAKVVADGLDSDEQSMLLGWTESLLEIRASRKSQADKARATLAATFDGDLLLLLGKVLFVEAKRSVWDAQSPAVRAGLIVAAIVALAFAGPLLGLAVLLLVLAGPLWLVFGGGFPFVEALRDELLARVPPESTLSPL